MIKIFLSILLLFGAILLGVSFIMPGWQHYRDLRDRVNTLDDLNKKFNSLAEKRDQLQTQINGISKDDLDRAKKAIPQGPHAAEFLVLMENLSSFDGALITSIDITSAAPNQAKAGTPQATATAAGAPDKLPGSITEYPINIGIIARYNDLKKFLGDLQQSLRLIDIGDISFSGLTKKDDAVPFSIKLKTYYQ